jgi:acyl-CoA reductase-like NAD-dependent aldehyde dehydrogenase
MSCMAKGPLSIVAPFLGGRLFIGGVWRKSVSPSVFPVYNPSSGQVIGECAEACEDDVNSAVDAARSCFDSTSGWSQDAQTRAEVLRKLAAIIKRDAAEVAALETLDMGKPGPEVGW